MVRFGLGALTRQLTSPRPPAPNAGPQEVDLSVCVNAEFFRMLLQAPYQHIDVSKAGSVGFEEFAAYFAWVATDEELRFAFDVLQEGSDDDRLTYGTLQSFQQRYDVELFLNLKQGKVGCPDYLEYCTLLLGIRTHCKRPDFLALEGVAVPPRPAWLLARLEEEWGSRETLQVHWRYVTQPVPEGSEERRFPDWNGGFSVRDEGHEGFTVQDFLRCPEASQAGLSEAEVLALRLYTGPGYEPLNKSLRANSQRFPVTQYCIDSAVGKLAQLGTRRSLLRGMKKRMHPRWVRQYDLYRGVGDKRIALSDPAFVSTTTDLEVANGSNFGGPILFVLHTADVRGQRGSFLSLGAELDWVSQYPGEEEVLLPSNSVFIPRLRCKHLRDHGLDVPPSKNVYEFDVFYPWDFEHNCPLMTNDYLAVANQLLLLQHEADVQYCQTCRDGHLFRFEEKVRNATPTPSRTVTPPKAAKSMDHLAPGLPLKGAKGQRSRSSSRPTSPGSDGFRKGTPSEVPSPMRCSSDVGTCFSSEFACIDIGACEDPIVSCRCPALYPSCSDSPLSPQSPDGWSFQGLPLELDLATALSNPSDLDTLPSPARSLSSLQDYAFRPIDLPAGPGGLAGTAALRLRKLKLYTLKDVALLEMSLGVKPVLDCGLTAAADTLPGAFPAKPSLYCNFENSVWDMGRLVFTLTSIALSIGLPLSFVSLVGSLSTAMAMTILATTGLALAAAIAVPIAVAVALAQGDPAVPQPPPNVTLTATPTVMVMGTLLAPTPTASPSPTQSHSPTCTATQGNTLTNSPTVSASGKTATATVTPSRTVSATATHTSTPSPSRSPSHTRSATASATPTTSRSPTVTPTPTPSVTLPGRPTPSATASPTATLRRTASTTTTGTATRTSSSTGSQTTSCTASHTPTQPRTVSPTFSPTSSQLFGPYCL